MSLAAPPAISRATRSDRIWFAEQFPVGVQFTERMCGYISREVSDPDEKAACRKAAERGEAKGWSLECTFTVIADDLEAMLSDWRHKAGLVGTVTLRRPSRDPMTVAVRDGEFRLFEVCADRVETRRIWYRMKVTPDGMGPYYIEGYKEVRNSLPFRAWADLTTLYLTISRGNYGRAGSMVAQGILRLSLGDFLLQLGTIRARNARRFVERFDAPARFIGFFAGILLSAYGRVLAPSTVATPDPPPPKAPRRSRWMTPEEIIEVRTSDGVSIYLTRYRYRGASKGPVMLVPGFTMVAESFNPPTVETGLVQYLCREGFDVWLLDYRASPAVPAVWTSFTLDDIARRDYPAAVRVVYERTGGKKVQIVAHCVGSVSLFMSLLDGQLEGWVRSVVCSQSTAYFEMARFTEAKSGAYLAALLKYLGVRHISASFDPRAWGDWLVDQILKLYPTHERCNNPVCRRILFIFHEIYRHEQLNAETHDALWLWFGTSSIAALRHLTLMVRTGYVVDAEAQDVYLRHDDPARYQQQLRRLRLPISFMHGELNHAFLPGSTLNTYRRLRAVNGRRWYRWRRFKGYAHFDCFAGRSAAAVVFPWIVKQLENPPQP